MYMSSHPDTLVGYAKYHGKVKASDLVSAKMVSIDSKVRLVSLYLELISYVAVGYGLDVCHEVQRHPATRPCPL